MKNNFKFFFRVSFVAFLAILLSAGQVATVSGETLEMKYDAPAVELVVDGSYTPDTASLSALGVSDDLLSIDPDFRMPLPEDMQELGFHEVYYDTTLQSWRISFTSVIDAPLINIWTEEAEDNSFGSVELNAAEDDIRSGPTQAARSDKAMGLPFLYGDLNYLLENDTDDSGATYDYTTDFLLSTYDVLYLDDIGDYSASNLSIVVSYVEDLTYTDLTNANAHNITIFNEPVDGYDDLWFRLDLENSNTTHDEYVANIEFNNFDIRGGKYVLGTDANTTDTRYETNYIGSLSTSLSLSAADRYGEVIEPQRTHNAQRGLGLSSWFSDLSSSDIMSTVSDFTGLSSDSVSEARGWESAADLEGSVVTSIVDKSDNDNIDDADDVSALTLSDAIMNWKMPSSLTDVLDSVIGSAVDKVDTVSGVIDAVKKAVTPRVNFATDVSAPEVSASSAPADDARDVTSSVVAASEDGSSNFGTNILDDITNTAGEIWDSAVSIYTGIQKDLDDISPGLGNLLPFLILGGLAILAVAFVMMRRM